jgi:hypothetical protein
VRVVVVVRVGVVRLARDAGHDLDAAMLDAPQGQQAVGDALEQVGAAAHDDDLEAQIMVDVHVQGRADLLAEVVLQVGQPLAQIAHVVVIDQGERPDGIHALGHPVATDLGARQVAKQLRARAAARTHHGVQIAQE